jgi:hypothetical protein
VVYGGTCVLSSDCESDFCVKGSAATRSAISRVKPAKPALRAPAPAPAVSHPALLLIVVLLVAVGCFALTPLRFGKRR